MALGPPASLLPCFLCSLGTKAGPPCSPQQWLAVCFLNPEPPARPGEGLSPPCVRGQGCPLKEAPKRKRRRRRHQASAGVRAEARTGSHSNPPLQPQPLAGKVRWALLLPARLRPRPPAPWPSPGGSPHFHCPGEASLGWDVRSSPSGQDGHYSLTWVPAISRVAACQCGLGVSCELAKQMEVVPSSAIKRGALE